MNETPPDIPPAQRDLPISNHEKPSKREIKKVILALKNGKAAEPDEILPEAIKAGVKTAVAEVLDSRFSRIREEDAVSGSQLTGKRV